MPFFGAVKPTMAIDPKGVSVFPSAGPYRIASRTIGAVADAGSGTRTTRAPAGERGPDRLHGQHGPEPEPAPGSRRPGGLRRLGLPPTAHADLAQQYGVKKGGAGRYFVNPTWTSATWR